LLPESWSIAFAAGGGVGVDELVELGAWPRLIVGNETVAGGLTSQGHPGEEFTRVADPSSVRSPDLVRHHGAQRGIGDESGEFGVGHDQVGGRIVR
jgi:hypothetical protein